MPRHFYPGRHKHGFGRRNYHPFNSLVWIIGLGILFMTHSWWPGIMILVGITMVLNTFANSAWSSDRPEEVDENTPWKDWTNQSSAPQPMSAPQPTLNQPSEVQGPTSQSSTVPQQEQYAGWLPVSCPNCGAPVRPHSVHWTGQKTADCAYCGSALPQK